MIYQGAARHPVREVVLHCSACEPGQLLGMSAFQVWAMINRWHTEDRGWKNGFGYHGLIMPDGSWHDGRPWAMVGAHVLNHNQGTLGWLLIESKRVTRIATFEDYFTPQQRLAVQARLRTVPGLLRVSGHNDYAPKLCPGFKVISEEWMPKH